MHTASPIFDAGKAQSLPYNPMTNFAWSFSHLVQFQFCYSEASILKTFESNFSLKHF